MRGQTAPYVSNNTEYATKLRPRRTIFSARDLRQCSIKFSIFEENEYLLQFLDCWVRKAGFDFALKPLLVLAKRRRSSRWLIQAPMKTAGTSSLAIQQQKSATRSRLKNGKDRKGIGRVTGSTRSIGQTIRISECRTESSGLARMEW
jgi:hypothetical protein